MVITYSDGRFVARSRFEEKDSVKTAGFRWDPAGRVWWTKFKESAARLIDYCDGPARAALADHVGAVQASRATDAEVDVPAPDGLRYLPYQRGGIAYALARQNVLIGDEPGLGKTIQALGIVNASPQVRRTLVVCPASLRLNWRREAQKWLTRKTRVQVIVNGADGVTLPDDQDLLVVVGYEGLIKRLDLQVVRWDVVIVDEAHRIKNPEAQRTRAVSSAVFLSGRKVFLTGTPILNRPAELWPLLEELVPTESRDAKGRRSLRGLGSFFGYAKRYCAAHQKQAGRKKVWDFSGSSNLPELQEKLRGSVMVRRLKADVLPELPAKRRQVVELDVKGRDGTEISGLMEALEEADAFEGSEEEEIAAEGARRREAALAKVSFEALSGYRREMGLSKVKSAVEYVSTLREGGVDKVIVFAHHLEVIAGLRGELEKVLEEGEVVVQITGEMGDGARQAAVDAFQEDPRAKIIICSIMAAGVGLTLTASSTVVFVESDWVPANVTQAEDRAHRIGQRWMVSVHQLVVPGTLDAYMAATVARKQEVADAALDRSTKITVAEIPVRKLPTFNVASERRAEMLGVLRLLSGMCDGAMRRDECGFNKLDTAFGRSLASRLELSDGMFFAAHKMCRKYRRQISEAAYASLWGEQAGEREGGLHG